MTLSMEGCTIYRAALAELEWKTAQKTARFRACAMSCSPVNERRSAPS